MSTPNITAVVIPTYNERDNIVGLIEAVRSALDSAHVLVVDDGSPDGTAALVREVMVGCPAVELLERPRKEGLGPAYIAGFRHVLRLEPRAVVQMDADFSHRPEDLPRLVAAVEDGADLAVGSRYVGEGRTEDWGVGRRLTSRLGSLYARVLLSLPVRDVTGGFRCWRVDLLSEVLDPALVLTQFGFQIEMLYRVVLRGARIREVPIVFPDRVRGESKMHARIVWEALFGVWRLRAARLRLGGMR